MFRAVTNVFFFKQVCIFLLTYVTIDILCLDSSNFQSTKHKISIVSKVNKYWHIKKNAYVTTLMICFY